MKKLVNTLVKTLMEKKLTVALAESITCGLAAHQLNIVKGTSQVLKGSIVCYNENVKTDLLKVSPTLIKKYTAESQQVTDELAKKLHNLIEADIYAAVTGLAAAGGSETKEKPVGTVFLSILYKKRMMREEKQFKGSPLEIKKQACKALYQMMLDAVDP
jgi:nicotinamide-nucleotide amidase